MSSSYIKLELYNLLIKLGAPEGEARAASEGYLPSDEIATKSDLAQLEAKLMKFTQDMGWKIGGVIGSIVVGVIGLSVGVTIAIMTYL